MKRTLRAAVLVVLMMGAIAILQPTGAICGGGFFFFASGDSYVYTPGCGYNGCGTSQTSMTDDAVGFFWAIGSGAPELGPGNDNGALQFQGGWAGGEPGYPTYISGNWRTGIGQGIDGCIEAAPDKCMAILLMDNDADTGEGAFTLLTDAPDHIGNYNFDQGGPIILVTLDRLVISHSVQTGGGTGVDVTVAGIALTDIEASLYLDPSCLPATGFPGMIAGYQVYVQELTRGGVPADNNVANWARVGPLVPLGNPSTASLSCTGDKDLFLTVGLSFDSNFELTWLSGNSTRIECGPNLAEPEDEIQRKPRNRERPRSRTRNR